MSRFVIAVVCSIISVHHLTCYVEDNINCKKDQSGCAPQTVLRSKPHRRTPSDEIKPPVIFDGIRDINSPLRK